MPWVKPDLRGGRCLIFQISAVMGYFNSYMARHASSTPNKWTSGINRCSWQHIPIPGYCTSPENTAASSSHYTKLSLYQLKPQKKMLSHSGFFFFLNLYHISELKKKIIHNTAILSPLGGSFQTYAIFIENNNHQKLTTGRERIPSARCLCSELPPLPTNAPQSFIYHQLHVRRETGY